MSMIAELTFGIGALLAKLAVRFPHVDGYIAAIAAA